MTYTDYEPDIKVDIAAQEVISLTDNEYDIVDPMRSGFVWYRPPLSVTEEHVTGGQQWQISGHDMQVLTMSIPANEIITTEVGSFMFGSPNIDTEVELTLFGQNGCTQGCGRICGGENCVKVLLSNKSSSEGYIGLTPTFPAKIIPIKFGTHIKEGSYLITQAGTYMAELGDVNVSCDPDCSISTCCCAGFGCCRQKIQGTNNSVAFLAAGGTLLYRNLDTDETITVDSHSVVAIENTVTIGIVSNGRFCTCLCGGEGCFSTTLTGPGKVFIQSMNLFKFRDAVQTTVIVDRGSSSTTPS